MAVAIPGGARRHRLMELPVGKCGPAGTEAERILSTVGKEIMQPLTLLWGRKELKEVTGAGLGSKEAVCLLF